MMATYLALHHIRIPDHTNFKDIKHSKTFLSFFFFLDHSKHSFYNAIYTVDFKIQNFFFPQGHAAPILYAAWAEAGLFPVSDLAKLRTIDSDLEGHPTPVSSMTLFLLCQGWYDDRFDLIVTSKHYPIDDHFLYSHHLSPS